MSAHLAGKDKKRPKEGKSKRAREKREGKRWPLSVRRLFFVHANPVSAGVYVCMRACISRGVGTCVWGRCIIVSAGSWLGGPVDISGLRCSCLSGSRTRR